MHLKYYEPASEPLHISLTLILETEILTSKPEDLSPNPKREMPHANHAT